MHAYVYFEIWANVYVLFKYIYIYMYMYIQKCMLVYLDGMKDASLRVTSRVLPPCQGWIS